MGVLTGRNEDRFPAGSACEHLAEIFAMLDSLSRKASEILARRKAKAADVEILAGHVAEIRQLLSELSRLSLRHGNVAAPHEECRDLAARYLELEGMVKELRNDLAAQ